MVFKEGWVDRAFDWASVVCFAVGSLALVFFAYKQPGALLAMVFVAVAGVGVYMGIRGFIIIVDWLDK